MRRKDKAIINPHTMQISNRDPRTYAIIGAAMEVHRIMGSGFLVKATGLESGLLLNFGTENLEYKRFVFTNGKSV